MSRWGFRAAFQTRCSSFSIVTNTISQVCFETHEAIAGTVPVHTDAIAQENRLSRNLSTPMGCVMTHLGQTCCLDFAGSLKGSPPLIHTLLVLPRPDFTVIILRGDSSAIVSCDRQQIASKGWVKLVEKHCRTWTWSLAKTGVFSHWLWWMLEHDFWLDYKSQLILKSGFLNPRMICAL